MKQEVLKNGVVTLVEYHEEYKGIDLTEIVKEMLLRGVTTKDVTIGSEVISIKIKF